MKRMVFLAVVLAAMVGCGARGPSPASLIANTESGRACWRQCVQTGQVCESGCETAYGFRGGTTSDAIASGFITGACRHDCGVALNNCFSTCPQAPPPAVESSSAGCWTSGGVRRCPSSPVGCSYFGEMRHCGQ